MLINDRIIGSISSPITWSVMTSIAIIILIFDGVVTNLPSYNLQSRQSLAPQLFFIAEVLTSAFIQLVYLRIAKQKFDVNPTIGHFRKYSDIIYYVVTITQYIIIGLLLMTLIELEILAQYHTVIPLVLILLSVSLSAGISGILAFRFLLWIKNKRDPIIVAYTAVAILVSVNSIFIAVFMPLEMEGKPMI